MIDPTRLTAAEVMTTDVITLHEDTAIDQAVSTLEDYGVSGAPVVNDAGECKGVFTIADVVARRISVEDAEAPSPSGWFNFDPLDEEGGGLDKDGWVARWPKGWAAGFSAPLAGSALPFFSPLGGSASRLFFTQSS